MNKWVVTGFDIMHELRPNISFSMNNTYNSIRIHSVGVTIPTLEEYNNKKNELTSALAMKALRFERDKRLKEYDWMTLRAASGGVPLTDEWKAYLQELRDMPETKTPQISNGSLVGITWPTIPGEATETAGVTTTSGVTQ